MPCWDGSCWTGRRAKTGSACGNLKATKMFRRIISQKKNPTVNLLRWKVMKVHLSRRQAATGSALHLKPALSASHTSAHQSDRSLYTSTHEKHYRMWQLHNTQQQWNIKRWLFSILTVVCRKYTGLKPAFFQNLAGSKKSWHFKIGKETSQPSFPRILREDTHLSSCVVRP